MRLNFCCSGVGDSVVAGERDAARQRQPGRAGQPDRRRRPTDVPAAGRPDLAATAAGRRRSTLALTHTTVLKSKCVCVFVTKHTHSRCVCDETHPQSVCVCEAKHIAGQCVISRNTVLYTRRNILVQTGNPRQHTRRAASDFGTDPWHG